MAFIEYPTIGAVVRGDSDVSVTAGLNSVMRSAIGAIADDTAAPIEYTHAVFDEETQRWISVAEVAESCSLRSPRRRKPTTFTVG
ncbi:hypothetical protein FEZ60_24605 [Rhodococcus sp. MS16]|nr:hypothetical protein [Rhodococcus globerulus]NRI68704.1 hypothetical protein [Rhodococcus sp. MS16]